MRLFDIFKKTNDMPKLNTDNGVLGPGYLDNFTVHIDNPVKLQPHEWRRKVSNNGQTKFQIKYYGQQHGNHKNLIVGTEFSEPLIYAIDVLTKQEILLWDGCKYGYDPIFCKEFSEEQINNRRADNSYVDIDGKEIFEIIVSTYYQFDFDEEMGEVVDSDGFLELHNGQKIKFDEAKRDGFDCIIINITNEHGKTTEIVSEELA